MQVTIKYTKKFGRCQGGIEAVTTPLNSDYDSWRVRFGCINELKRWALLIEEYIPDNDQRVVDGKWRLLPCWGIKIMSDEPCNKEDYFNWLSQFVEWIEVDGHQFWTNKNLNEEDESCYIKS